MVFYEEGLINCIGITLNGIAHTMTLEDAIILHKELGKMIEKHKEK